MNFKTMFKQTHYLSPWLILLWRVIYGTQEAATVSVLPQLPMHTDGD